MTRSSIKSHERWLNAMRAGDLERAWRQTDALEMPRRLGLRESASDLRWDGQSLRNRRVLVRCLHGLGDTLQFSRFLPLLRAQASELVVAVQTPLVDFFRMQHGIGEVRDGWKTWQNDEGFAEVEIMELAYVFRAKLENLPPPCLRARPDWPVRPGSRRRRVAIFWTAGDWRREHSLSLAEFDPLAGARGVVFFSFQQGACESEAAASALRPIRLSAHTRDIRNLARALNRMDLVISVDTMAAHLAGSLGRPVWLLLDPDPDWRWMDAREDTPWYPGMRIFRSRGGWKEVILRLRDELESL